MTLGEWLRERFESANTRGAVPTDLHRTWAAQQRASALRTTLRPPMTYSSFMRYMQVLKLLSFIERTGETEPAKFIASTVDARVGVLDNRVFWRITQRGLDAPQESWKDPFTARRPQRSTYRRAPRRVGRPPLWRLQAARERAARGA